MQEVLAGRFLEAGDNDLLQGFDPVKILSQEKLANALALFGVKRAVIVCGNDELDEVSLWGTTTAFVVEEGRVTRTAWEAKELTDRSSVSPEELRVSSPAESADRIRAIFAGEASSGTEIVVANAAAALFAAGRAPTIAEGLEVARQTLSTGAAARTLSRLAELSSRLASKPDR